MNSFIDAYKRYATFSKKEKADLLLSVLVVSFVFWFAALDIKAATFDIAIEQILKYIIIVGVGFVLHELAHRTFALAFGIQAEYEAFKLGLLVSAIIAFFTGWIILAPGAVKMKIIQTHRLFHHRYQMGPKMMGLIALAGPLANVVLAVIFKLLSEVAAPAFFLEAMHVNLLLAVFNMLPIPPLDGSKVFFGMRYLYAFSFIGMIILAALLSFSSTFASLLTAVVFGAIGAWYYFVHIDQQWKG